MKLKKNERTVLILEFLAWEAINHELLEGVDLSGMVTIWIFPLHESFP